MFLLKLVFFFFWFVEDSFGRRSWYDGVFCAFWMSVTWCRDFDVNVDFWNVADREVGSIWEEVGMAC